MKSESDWILEKAALENRWRSMELELRAQMKKMKQDHEQSMNDLNSKLHSALMSKSVAQGKVSELENKFACEAKKMQHQAVMMEKLQIENDRLIQQNMELGKVNQELSFKIGQMESMTTRYKQALVQQEADHNDAMQALRNSHAVEQQKLRQEISGQVKELSQANAGLVNKISEMKKAYMELRACEKQRAEEAEQLRCQLEQLKKEKVDLQGQVEQLSKIKAELEKQQNEKAMSETVYERRSSVSSSELMSPASIRGNVPTETSDLEILMVKQKRLIQHLGETVDALTKYNMEEAEVMMSRMKMKDAKIGELMNMLKE